MPDEPTKIDPSLEEQLVAYLDGELDAEAAQRIEELLATNAEVRDALQRLDRTWDLLDELDRPEVGDRFAQSTLEMVAVAATKDAAEVRAKAPSTRRRRRNLMGVGIVVAGLVGFAAVALFAPDRNRQLLRDLPILENLGPYRQIKDVQFLRTLHSKDVFAEPVAMGPDSSETPDPSDPADGSEDPATARQRVEQMSPAEKEQLARQNERFEALPPAERRRIGQLHDQLERASDGDQLREVMQRYHRWLTSLPPYQRAELIEMEPSKRIEQIESLLAEEHRQQARAQDFKGLLVWMKGYVARNEARLFEALPKSRRKHLEKAPEEIRRRVLGFSMLRPGSDDPSKRRAPLSDEDLSELRQHLSEETRQELQGLSAPEQWKRIGEKVRAAFLQRQFKNIGGPLTQASEKELDRFFEEELTSKDRDRLLTLPGEEMRRELRRMYYLKKIGWRPSMHRPRHPSHRNRPNSPGPTPPPPKDG